MGYIETGWTTVQTIVRARARSGRAAAVWDNQAMAGRPRTPEGDKIRDDILVYLRRLELVNAPKPTFREIGTLIERTHRPTIDYLRSLRSDELVTWVERQPRTLSLTDKGRDRANKLLAPSPS